MTDNKKRHFFKSAELEWQSEGCSMLPMTSFSNGRFCEAEAQEVPVTKAVLAVQPAPAVTGRSGSPTTLNFQILFAGLESPHLVST